MVQIVAANTVLNHTFGVGDLLNIRPSIYASNNNLLNDSFGLDIVQKYNFKLYLGTVTTLVLYMKHTA